LKKKIEALLFDFVLYAYIGWALVWSFTQIAFEDPPSLVGPVLFGGLVMFGALLTVFSRQQGLTLGAFLTGQKEYSTSHEVKSFWQRPHAWSSALFVVCTALVGWYITDMDLREFFDSDGFDGAKRLFGALFTPNFSIFPRALSAIIETVFIAFMATFLALPIAFVMSFCAAHNIMDSGPVSRAVYSATRFFMNFARSIEPIIWAIIFSIWIGIGPFAGMMALFTHSVVSLAKLYSEQIETIEAGPIEAMESVGANRLQVIAYAVVPQVILPFISFTIYRWDINVRMATIIGLVGGGGIGTLLMQYQGLARWNEVGLIIFMIAFVVWAMDNLSARLRKSIS